mmetsp:Transcript_5824/g.18324  ORF Transcript_5824/g.18324 Transcript_5824/m.18324 type:complete len:241 (+) Transcript_5824:94-816(+)
MCSRLGPRAILSFELTSSHAVSSSGHVRLLVLAVAERRFLAPVGVAHEPAQDLARRRLWDLVGQLDASAQPLVRRHAAGHPVDDRVGLGARRARAVRLSQHNVRARHLSALRVRERDDGRVEHVRMREQHGLELGGRDLKALEFDELFGAIRDPDEATLVHARDVARAKPRRAVGGADEGPRGRLGVVQVAEHHLRPAHEQLALRAVRHVDDLLVALALAALSAVELDDAHERGRDGRAD